MLLPQEIQDQKIACFSVGLDPSLTGFGVYCLPINHTDLYHWTLQSIASESDTRRVLSLADAVIEDIANLPHPVAVACFEDYGPINRMSGKICQRAEICGILKHHFLTARRAPVITIGPNALKTFATGNGKASKEDMLNQAAREGFYPNTNDEADAYFAAKVGLRAFKGTKVGASFERVNPE